jgi:phosphopantothenoylcysteine decarboxylase/phosphopantothenate--cysteine ligase
MLEHEAGQETLARLQRRAVAVVEPGEGYLACGWVGKGRLAEPEAIIDAAARMVERDDTLRGIRMLVTAGPTYEDIDPVRFIGNRSSGRMGYAIAAEAVRRGAEVTLVSGPVSLPQPPQMTVVRVRRAEQMHTAVFERAADADVIVMAAAVANYAPREPAGQKIAHESGGLTLELGETRDILADLAAWRRGRAVSPLLVGFAAETHDVVERARAKRVRKGIDLIVANDVSRQDAGFEVDTNAVTLIAEDGEQAVPLSRKDAVARTILDRIAGMLAARPARA